MSTLTITTYNDLLKQHKAYFGSDSRANDETKRHLVQLFNEVNAMRADVDTNGTDDDKLLFITVINRLAQYAENIKLADAILVQIKRVASEVNARAVFAPYIPKQADALASFFRLRQPDLYNVPEDLLADVRRKLTTAKHSSDKKPTSIIVDFPFKKSIIKVNINVQPSLIEDFDDAKQKDYAEEYLLKLCNNPSFQNVIRQQKSPILDLNELHGKIICDVKTIEEGRETTLTSVPFEQTKAHSPSNRHFIETATRLATHKENTGSHSQEKYQHTRVLARHIQFKLHAYLIDEAHTNENKNNAVKEAIDILETAIDLSKAIKALDPLRQRVKDEDNTLTALAGKFFSGRSDSVSDAVELFNEIIAELGHSPKVSTRVATPSITPPSSSPTPRHSPTQPPRSSTPVERDATGAPLRSIYTGTSLPIPATIYTDFNDVGINKPEIAGAYRAFYLALQNTLNAQADTAESSSAVPLAEQWDTLASGDNLLFIGPYFGLGDKAGRGETIPDVEHNKIRKWLDDLDKLSRPTPLSTVTVPNQAGNESMLTAAVAPPQEEPLVQETTQVLKALFDDSDLVIYNGGDLNKSVDSIKAENAIIHAAKTDIDRQKDTIEKNSGAIEFNRTEIKRRQAIITLLEKPDSLLSGNEAFKTHAVAAQQAKIDKSNGGIADLEQASDTSKVIIQENEAIISASEKNIVAIYRKQFNDVLENITKDVFSINVIIDTRLEPKHANEIIRGHIVALDQIETRVQQIKSIYSPVASMKAEADDSITSCINTLINTIHTKRNTLVNQVEMRLANNHVRIITDIAKDLKLEGTAALTNLSHAIVDYYQDKAFLVELDKSNEASIKIVKSQEKDLIEKMALAITYLEKSEGEHKGYLNSNAEKDALKASGCKNIESARMIALAIIAMSKIPQPDEKSAEFNSLCVRAERHVTQMKVRADNQTNAICKFFSPSRGHEYKKYEKDITPPTPPRSGHRP